MRFKRVLPLVAVCLLPAGCGQNPYQADLDLAYASGVLTALPCRPADVTVMQPFGVVTLPAEPYRFHNGIDISTHSGDPFYSCADGRVDKIELNTGVGWPGTNYRVTIQVNQTIFLDYHFEIGGSIAESERRANLFVSVGDYVTAGQHIANLVVLGDAAHVHFGVIENDRMDRCPVAFFSPEKAAAFEAMYDQPQVEKRPSWRDDLCQ